MGKKQIGAMMQESDARADWLAQQYARATNPGDQAYYELEVCRECDHYQFLLNLAV